MALPLNLDLDVLRTFVTGLDLGSYAKAAGRLGRSQSAISLQLRKLEETTGQTLLRKQGRGLALTPEGEIMLGYARRLLELNDEAVAALKQPSLAGQARRLLDPYGIRTMKDSIRQHAEAGAAIIVSSHQVPVCCACNCGRDPTQVVGIRTSRPADWHP